MELEKLEKDILKAIENAYPFTFGEITDVFEKVKSFDSTIAILKTALQQRKNPYDIIISLPPDPSRFLGPQKIESVSFTET